MNIYQKICIWLLFNLLLKLFYLNCIIFNLKASIIKRENRLWSDNIFLCKYLLIPIANIEDYNKNDFKIISKKDLIQSISKSKSVGLFAPLKNNFRALHNNYSPGLTVVTSDDEERYENVNCLRSNDINQVSAQDYFKKYDSSLAKIKKNVEKLEKQNRSRLQYI